MYITHEKSGSSRRFFKMKRRYSRCLSKRPKILKPRIDLRETWKESQNKKFGLNSALLKVFGKTFSGFPRRWFENPRIRTATGASLAILTIITGFARTAMATFWIVPATIPPLGTTEHDGVVISYDTELKTAKTVNNPLEKMGINQEFSIFHPGIDLEAQVGSVVRPIMNGVIREAGWSMVGYGNTVVIDHENGYSSRYAHLSLILVEKNQKVTTRTILGLSGNTGRSTGPHLHLEVLFGDLPINPRAILPNNSI